MAKRKESSEKSYNPLDIDGPNFDSEAFVSKLLKEKTLSELMDHEHKVVQQVRELDSEMQTLVYENYAKFITATDTIRQMRADFAQMETEMDKLAQNVEQITSFSEKVCDSLQGRRQNIQRLVETNSALENLQFILDLPKRLQENLDKAEHSKAVEAYVQTLPVLERYKHLPAFRGIDAECETIVCALKARLREKFQHNLTSAKELSQAFSFLVQLGEDSESLSEQYLDFARQQLHQDLDALAAELSLKEKEGVLRSSHTTPRQSLTSPSKPPAPSSSRPSDNIASLPVDVLKFVDLASAGVVTNLSLVMATYLDLFGDSVEHKKRVLDLMSSILTELFRVCEARFLLEASEEDSSLLVRALDRFYKRLQALAKLTPNVPGAPSHQDFSDTSLQIIVKVAKEMVNYSLARLKLQLNGLLAEIRGQLATPKAFLTSTGTSDGTNQHLSELLNKLESTLVQSLKGCLANLLQLTAYDIHFAIRADFLHPISLYVREGLVVAFFRHIVAICGDFCAQQNETVAGTGGSKAFVTSSVILLVSRFCLNLKASTIGYLVDLAEQQFRINEDVRGSLTPGTRLCEEMQRAAQGLLDLYVELEGFSLSQLLSKSVEARDWRGCVEPRAVRAVVKRVVEDLTAIDTRVGQLYEEGARRDRSSNSSRRTGGAYSLSSRLHASRGGANASSPHAGGQSLMVSCPAGPNDTNNALLKKLWSEKIDYFCSVDFTRVSIVTGVVKICLKTFLECIRLETFGKFGLQQVQVDAHYLQLYLWRFVSDENLVQHLLEEIMSSAALRCSEPVLMEPSVVEVICERG